jgi:transposase
MSGEAVEIITGRERRRRWSVADKLRILAECDEPGAQVSEVAARHGVYRSLVFQWRRQARDGLLTAERVPEFVPVCLADAEPPTARPEMPVPDAAPVPSRQQARSAGLVEIEMPDGVRVRVGDEVGLATLRRVLAALRG